jgi:endonuclease/exonuclease/phosphatase family metal-dependent hydrolase
MGDFNDEPSSKSIAETLRAMEYRPDNIPVAAGLQLFNLFRSTEKQTGKGSYKYRGEWDMLDQIIVSENLVAADAHFRHIAGSAKICSEDFLLTDDKSGGGRRPLRTFLGLKYEGGFSDHLPVYADFLITRPK